MPYNPKGFNDVGGDATMAPSELQPPLNFADGGAVGWAGDTTVYNTQSQIGNMLATPGGFSGMSRQFTAPSPMAMAEGGSVNSLVSRLSHEFSKRGLDLNKFMARRLAQQGQSGDTMLAHINPEEAAMLKKAGGSGTLNPHTGLQEFYRSGGDSAWGGSSRSDSTSARAGDTPGFGSGGGGSVGGGGGYGSTSSGISGGGGGSDRSSGGGGRESPVYTSPTSNQTASILNAQRAAQEAADQAAAANAARIAAERASYQAPPAPAPAAPEAPSAPTSLSNIFNQLIGITPAQAGTFDVTGPEYQSRYQFNPVPTRSAFEQALDEANVKETLAEAEANAPFARTGFPTGLGILAKSSGLPAQFTQPAVQTTTFSKDQSGIVPAGVWTDQQMSMPSLRDAAEQARIQAAKAAEAAKPDTFFSDLQRVNEKLNAIRGMDTSNLVGSGRGVSGPSASEIASAKSPFSAYNNAIVQGTRSPFEAVVESVTKPAVADEQGAMVDAATKANIQRRNDVYSYTPPSSFDPITKQAVAEEEAAAAAPQAPAAKVAATQSAPAKTASSQVAAQAAPVLATAKKAVAAPVVTAPATQAADQGILSKIMADINNANAKRIAELEKAGEFAGGSKEQVAAALNVDPSQLQSRIVNYDGKQKVDYFTKGLDQVLGEMISGPFKAIGNLFGGGNYDLKNGYSITPSGDVVPTPVYTPPTGGGGGGGMAQAPVVAPVQAAAAPAVTTPVSPALPQALASFKRKYVPLTNYATYGYGPESALYEYTAAEGGAVGPLSQKRK